MAVEASDNKYIYRNNWFLNGKIRQISKNDFVCISNAAKWQFVNSRELASLKSVKISNDLFSKFESKGLIITHNNSSSIFEQYKNWNDIKYGDAFLHIIEMTTNCNLSCAYCHVSASSITKENRKINNLSFETAEKILDFIFTTPSKKIHIEFQGGESLLNFPVVEYIVKKSLEMNRVAQKQLSFSIVSNLISLNEKQCEFFKQFEINYTTTIDGPQFLHDKNRTYPSGKGSFNSVMNSIQLLQNKGMSPPGVLTVITKHSVSHIEQMVEMFDDIGLNKIGFIFVSSLGVAKKNWDDIGISIHQEIQAYKKVIDKIIEKWKDGKFISERLFNLALYKILSDTDTLYMDFRNPCGLAKGQIAYNIKGEIFGCDEGRSYERFKIGNVENSGYQEVIKNPLVDELISESFPNYPECQSCAYESLCGICPVRHHADDIDKSTSQNDPNCHFNIFIYDYCFRLMKEEPNLLKSYIAYKEMVDNKIFEE